MTTRRWWCGALGLSLAMLGWFGFESGLAQQSTKPKDKEAVTDKAEESERAADEKAILASAEKFVKAFNAHDARAAAAQFLPKAEYLNSDGEAFQGREAIEKDLAEYFNTTAHLRA